LKIKTMKKSFKFRRIAGFILIGTAAILLFGFIVMQLWNNVLTSAIAVNTISFGQALGILLLSKILFGGFSGGRGGGWKGRREPWNEQMKEKWQTMTPEEQEKVKHEWRNRYNRWCRTSQTQHTNEERKTDTAL
jgi:thiosulfate reductase cytochrome b subunit